MREVWKGFKDTHTEAKCIIFCHDKPNKDEFFVRLFLPVRHFILKSFEFSRQINQYFVS